MRSLFVLLISLLILISALAACNTSGNIALLIPTPEVSEVPAASPVPSMAETAVEAPSPAVSPEFETIITEFVSSQNTHDWNTFLSLWTSEEQRYYKDFFAYADNKKNMKGYFAIKSAELTGIYEIANVNARLNDDTSFDLPCEIEDGFNYDLPDAFNDVRIFIIKADYGLDKAFWDYREGTNYRVIVLVSEGGQWKVVQDYQGYPAAAEYFGDPVNTHDEDDEEAEDIEDEKNNLVNGTVHFTKKLECYFLGLEWGDYGHIGVRTIEGNEIWFWLGHTKFDPEKLKKNQKIRITWQNCDVYIDEIEEVINEDLVIDIMPLD